MTPASDNAQSLDVRDYLRPIWRRKWLILILVVVVTGGTYLYYRHQPRQYTATTSLLIQPSAGQTIFNGQTVAQQGPRNVDDAAQLLQTPLIAATVARQLHYQGDPAALLNDIQVAPSATDDFFNISATLHDPVFAAQVVNAFANAFITEGATQTHNDLVAALKATQARINSIDAQLHSEHRSGLNNVTLSTLNTTAENLALQLSLPSATAEQVDTAQVPTTPVSPRPARNALFAFALALLLGIIGAYALERFDRRISGLNELEPLLDSHLLVAVPRVKDPLAAPMSQNGGSPELREAFRTLRATLTYSSANGNSTRSLLVTSAVAGEGKTTIVRNLASAYAEVGLRVAVIDCDLRRAELGKTLGLGSEPGLTDVIEGRAVLADVLCRVQADGEDIGRVVASTNGHGPPAPSSGSIDALTAGSGTSNIPGLLASTRLHEVLEELRRTHDMVIVDTPPLLSVSDAVALIPQVDGVVLVSRIGTATDEQAEAVRHVIHRIDGAHLLGVVANGVRKQTVYAGSYGYGY